MSCLSWRKGNNSHDIRLKVNYHPVSAMEIRNVLTTFCGLAAMVIVVVGFFNFSLMLEIWVKLLIGVLFTGIIVRVGKEILTGK